MRAIAKGGEPSELTEYRCSPEAVYDGPQFTSVKKIIREQLLIEQGYLCGYCMKRIDKTHMKVEHWHCQDNYPGDQLDYRNMLGVCQGNEGQPPNNQTCDTHKGNSVLKYNPANPSHRIESHIRFLGNGKIQSEDGDFDCQLNEVLNLNWSRLMDNRKAVWDTVHDKLSQESGNRTPAEIQKILNKWESPDPKGHLQEYCAVAIYYLRKRLAKSRKPV